MFNVGGGEVLVILVLALVVLGPDKLPEAARSVGKHLGDFRRISSGFRNEISNAMNLDGHSPPEPAPAPEPAARPAPTPVPTAVSAPISTASVSVPAPVPGTTTDAERERVPSAPVWADGPVDSFV